MTKEERIKKVLEYRVESTRNTYIHYRNKVLNSPLDKIKEHDRKLTQKYYNKMLAFISALELFTDEDYLEFCENVMKEKGIKWVSQE
jgi:hypothetical protein